MLTPRKTHKWWIVSWHAPDVLLLIWGIYSIMNLEPPKFILRKFSSLSSHLANYSFSYLMHIDLHNFELSTCSFWFFFISVRSHPYWEVSIFFKKLVPLFFTNLSYVYDIYIWTEGNVIMTQKIEQMQMIRSFNFVFCWIYQIKPMAFVLTSKYSSFFLCSSQYLKREGEEWLGKVAKLLTAYASYQL